MGDLICYSAFMPQLLQFNRRLSQGGNHHQKWQPRVWWANWKQPYTCDITMIEKPLPLIFAAGPTLVHRTHHMLICKIRRVVGPHSMINAWDRISLASDTLHMEVTSEGRGAQHNRDSIVDVIGDVDVYLTRLVTRMFLDMHVARFYCTSSCMELRCSVAGMEKCGNCHLSLYWWM